MRDVLAQYREIQIEIASIEKQIDRLEMLARSPRVTNLTGMPRAGNVTDGMDIVAKIEDLRDIYYSKLGLLLDLQAMAERALQDLDHEERTIIRYRFIDGMSRRKIADTLAYSESTVKRRIRRAMKILNNGGGKNDA